MRPHLEAPRCFSFKPSVSARLRGNDRQRFLALLGLTEDIRLVYDWLEEGIYWKRRLATTTTRVQKR